MRISLANSKRGGIFRTRMWQIKYQDVPAFSRLGLGFWMLGDSLGRSLCIVRHGPLRQDFSRAALLSFRGGRRPGEMGANHPKDPSFGGRTRTQLGRTLHATFIPHIAQPSQPLFSQMLHISTRGVFLLPLGRQHCREVGQGPIHERLCFQQGSTSRLYGCL